MGAIPIYPQEGNKKAERWNVIISSNPICLLLCTGMPMQATPSPWCLVVALQLAEYTEGTHCESVIVLFLLFSAQGRNVLLDWVV